MTRRRRREYQEHDLSRRERQIMGVVYRLGRAGVADIVVRIPRPPTADAVRRLCHILEEKGHLRSEAEGSRRIYIPTVERDRARAGALDHMLETFFAGSPHMLVATLLDSRRDQLSPGDIERLTRMVEEAEAGREDEQP